MPGWRDRFAAAPIWFLFLYFAVGWGGFMFIGTAIAPGPSWSVRQALFGGLFFGLFMTLWLALMRRRDQAAAGGRPISREPAVIRALRTGKAPSDPTWDQALLRLIQRRRGQLRWARRANPLLFGGIATLSIVLALTEGQGFWALMAVFFVGVVIWESWNAARSTARLAMLESELNNRSDR